MDYGSSSFTCGSLGERLKGFVFFLVLGWFTILGPAVFGLRQAIGQADPLADAMAEVGKGLRMIFGDLQALARASLPELLARMASGTIDDLFGGRAAVAGKDAATLIARAGVTCREFQDTWEHRLETLEDCPVRETIATVHGFWTWLQSPEVLPVIQAAGRRLGLGEDVAADRRRKLSGLVAEHAPHLAHGLVYGLYATVVFQLLVLELFYAWGHPRPLFWAACALAAFNLGRGALLLRDIARIWPVRAEAAAIAAAVGIPDLARFTARLLAGQALGMVTMLLLVVRFLALGEALQRPGNVLSGLHQTLAFIWDFYLAMARVIF